ncbi:MAG: citrate lyase holo-[Clostridia bacterium]|nr:citrate lyase holo-[acyl-carrier protein] synthase [Clostridia bacterium]
MEVTLKEILDAREERVRMQNEMQKENPYPLICFTMNIAGPIKTSPLIIRAFEYGLNKIEKAIGDYKTAKQITAYKNYGPMSLFSVMANAQEIKDICVKIEEECELGRLFDIDVIDVDGKKLERKKERCCIICGKSGRACAAGRLHSVEELQEKTQEIISRHFAKIDSKKIAEFARNCLIDEVRTTVKPGLVDLSNNGSHFDMNVQTFVESANALVGYFEECINIGINTAHNTPEDTFYALRKAGISAEKNMYKATNGVNTHKGIIYSLGVILGAIGRLWKPDAKMPKTADILTECSAMTKLPAKKDFDNIDGSTSGGRLYLERGEKGIRGEVADGFPSIKNVALPIYKSELANGKTKNDAGVITLLHLMANVYDTSIYNRGGDEGVKYAQEYATKLLGNSPTIKNIEEMDEAFIAKNLSPGGCADLLAITYFFAELENM